MATESAFGTTNLQQDYSIALNDVPDKGYFRLTEVDFDGVHTSYNPYFINCKINDESTSFVLTPNPVDTYTYLSAINPSGETYKIQILNPQGSVLKSFYWENAAESALKICTNDIKPGIYILRINCRAEQKNLKFIKK